MNDSPYHGPTRPDDPKPALVPRDHAAQGLSADAEPSLKLSITRAVLNSVQSGHHDEALGTLAELMAHPDPRIRLKAADSLAKRHEALLPKRSESVNLTQIQVLRDLTDEELEALRARLAPIDVPSTTTIPPDDEPKA